MPSSSLRKQLLNFEISDDTSYPISSILSHFPACTYCVSHVWCLLFTGILWIQSALKACTDGRKPVERTRKKSCDVLEKANLRRAVPFPSLRSSLWWWSAEGIITLECWEETKFNCAWLSQALSKINLLIKTQMFKEEDMIPAPQRLGIDQDDLSIFDPSTIRRKMNNPLAIRN